MSDGEALNHVMWNLAIALDYVPEGGVIEGDPDEVLSEALEYIWQYRDLRES